jgi:hypothetical protein
MLGYLLGVGLKGVGLVAAVVLILGLVALIRCRREDIPAIMRALGRGGAGRVTVYDRSATNVPCPVVPMISPSSFKTLRALTTVAVAMS